MQMLIELFDAQNLANNFFSLAILRPQKAVVFADEKEITPYMQNIFENFLRISKQNTQIVFQLCDVRNVTMIADMIENVIRENGEENCVVDVIGGTETLLMATGMCCRAHEQLRVVSQKEFIPIWVWGPDRQKEIKAELGITVKQMLAMAAGEMLRCGHNDWRNMDDELLEIIPRMFEIYRKHRSNWPDFTYYLQRLNNVKYRMKEGAFNGPKAFTAANRRRSIPLNMAIVMDLMNIGVVSECRMNQSSCTLIFEDPGMVKLLCDTGSWLELYIFSVLRKHSLYYDVEINPVISWDNDADNDDTLNELDLIATDNLRQLFISCKSGIPDNAAVNEVAAIVHRFGSQYTKAVLVTACNILEEAPAVYRRAMEMGVHVLDGSALEEEKVADFFEQLKKRND